MSPREAVLVLREKPGNDSVVKKQYEPPRLVIQDHMSRVTQKSGGHPDAAYPNWPTQKNPPGHITPESAGSGSGSLFDDPFDE